MVLHESPQQLIVVNKQIIILDIVKCTMILYFTFIY